MNDSALFVSTSFGRSSGFMARRIQQDWSRKYSNIYFLFANTGLEHEETLKFGQKLTDVFGIPVVWLEAVVDPRKGYGIRHKVVTYETASRNGEPFEAHTAKEGLPGPTNRKCSDRLKLMVMASYRRSLGYKKREAYTAIGIRSDEVDRINPKHLTEKIIYPLVTDWVVTKEMVFRWWEKQTFNLGIPDNLGNCVPCYQKTRRKLLSAMKTDPRHFDFIDMLEEKYGDIRGVDWKFEDGYRRTFFRGNCTTKDLRREAANGFDPYVDNQTGVYTGDLFGDALDEIDAGGDCDRGCIVNEAI